MLLYKVISAIRAESHITEGITKLEKYSHEAVSVSLETRRMIEIEGVMTINGKATHVVSRELSMGFTSALRDVYNIRDIPRPLELKTVNEVKELPSFRVGEHIRFTEERLEPQLAVKLDNNTKEIMKSAHPDVKLTPEMAERNPVLKNIFSKMSGKTFTTFGGWTVAIGLGIASAVTVVNEHRSRMTACMLYYYEYGQLRRCVIPTCTCKPVACTKKCNFCDEAQMKLLPQDMQVDNCGGFKGVGCMNCPSASYLKTNINEDNTLVATSDDSRFIRCHQPTFYEALTDIWGGVNEDILDIVKSSLSGVGWLVGKLPMIILIAICIIIAVIIISIITKILPNRRTQEIEYQPLLNSRSPSITEI